MVTKIFGRVVMPKKEYHEMVYAQKKTEELKDMLKHTEIMSDKKKMLKKYKKYFGRWYEDRQAGMIYQVKDLSFHMNKYSPEPGYYWKFLVWYPNHQEMSDVPIRYVEEELDDRLSLRQVRRKLGVKIQRKRKK